MAAKTFRPSPFRHLAAFDAYECRGCRALLEVPYMAVLRGSRAPVAVKKNPENRLVWLELMGYEHLMCGQPIQPRGDDGPVRQRTAPATA